jgi:hypothetical protein
MFSANCEKRRAAHTDFRLTNTEPREVPAGHILFSPPVWVLLFLPAVSSERRTGACVRCLSPRALIILNMIIFNSAPAVRVLHSQNHFICSTLCLALQCPANYADGFQRTRCVVPGAEAMIQDDEEYGVSQSCCCSVV